MTATAAPRRRLNRADRRAAILRGAAAAFARSGYAPTSMAEIAAEVGVSHLIVYRHFESKQALYEAVLGVATDALTDALAVDGAAGAHGPSPAAVLRAARVDENAFTVLWRHAAREPDFAPFADRARAAMLRRTRRALEPFVPAAHREWAAQASVAYVLDSVLAWIEHGDHALDTRFVSATQASVRAGVRSWARA